MLQQLERGDDGAHIWRGTLDRSRPRDQQNLVTDSQNDKSVSGRSEGDSIVNHIAFRSSNKSNYNANKEYRNVRNSVEGMIGAISGIDQQSLDKNSHDDKSTSKENEGDSITNNLVLGSSNTSNYNANKERKNVRKSMQGMIGVITGIAQQSLDTGSQNDKSISEQNIGDSITNIANNLVTSHPRNKSNSSTNKEHKNVRKSMENMIGVISGVAHIQKDKE